VLIPPFDIFRVLEDSQPLWLEAASTLDLAKVRVHEIGKSVPGEYLIFSQKTGHSISIVVPKLQKSS
jgi:hypothetical protein